MIDLGRAIKYPFSGPNAVSKILIGSVLALFAPLLVPVVILFGYQLRIIRDVLHARDSELPDWGFGTDLAGGAVLLAGTLVYYLPAIIFVIAGASLTLQAFDGFNLARLLLEDSGWTPDRGALALALLFGLLALAWMVLSAPIVMTGIARYAASGEFGALLNVPEALRQVWSLRAQASLLMLYLFVVSVLAHLISIVAVSACFLPAFVQFIHLTVIAHLNGQWATVLQAQRPRSRVVRPIAPPSGRTSAL